jgi:hypothetical protein
MRDGFYRVKERRAKNVVWLVALKNRTTMEQASFTAVAGTTEPQKLPHSYRRFIIAAVIVARAAS